MKARDAMTSPAITVTPQTRCKDAAALLVEHRISALPVVDEAGGLVGIVSEADLLPLETSPDPRSQERPLPPRSMPLARLVADVMTPEVYTVDENTDLGVVAQGMLEAGVKRFPVMRGREIAGVISRHDLVRVLATSDPAIEASVKQVLTDEGTRLSGVRVEVQDGIAVLTGDGDAQTLRLAEILARSVPGVLDARIVTTGR
jgi:CBS domain-containing protein